ncbi:MAG: hypothetical protein ACR2IE_12950 [Candidatus Sumerlaeaceae bacterium]
MRNPSSSHLVIMAAAMVVVGVGTMALLREIPRAGADKTPRADHQESGSKRTRNARATSVADSTQRRTAARNDRQSTPPVAIAATGDETTVPSERGGSR